MTDCFPSCTQLFNRYFVPLMILYMSDVMKVYLE